MTAPNPKLINWICQECGKPNQLQGTAAEKTTMRRFQYAVCAHCHIPRMPYEVRSGYFQCNQCHVVYKQTPTWNPIKGICRCCYMSNRRKALLNKPTTDGTN